MLTPTIIHCVSSSSGWRNRHRCTTQKNVSMMMMMRMMTAISSSNPILCFQWTDYMVVDFGVPTANGSFPNDHGRPLLPHPLPSDGGDTLAAFEQVFSFQ
jgi:hypothetical protein